MFGLKKKELKRDERDVLNIVRNLIDDGKIPYSELEPLVNKYSKIIDDEIERNKQESRQYQINCMKQAVENHKNDVAALKQKLDNVNKNIAEMKAEREDLKKQGYGRDENRLRNLCWWIFNNETDAESLEDELKKKEVQLAEYEKELLLKQVFISKEE